MITPNMLRILKAAVRAQEKGGFIYPEKPGSHMAFAALTKRGLLEFVMWGFTKSKRVALYGATKPGRAAIRSAKGGAK